MEPQSVATGYRASGGAFPRTSLVFVIYVYFNLLFKDEVNQIMETNLWLKQVSDQALVHCCPLVVTALIAARGPKKTPQTGLHSWITCTCTVLKSTWKDNRAWPLESQMDSLQPRERNFSRFALQMR